jgi:hypothetical protein
MLQHGIFEANHVAEGPVEKPRVEVPLQRAVSAGLFSADTGLFQA